MLTDDDDDDGVDEILVVLHAVGYFSFLKVYSLAGFRNDDDLLTDDSLIQSHSLHSFSSVRRSFDEI